MYLYHRIAAGTVEEMRGIAENLKKTGQGRTNDPGNAKKQHDH
jgi:hypothetical protein